MSRISCWDCLLLLFAFALAWTSVAQQTPAPKVKPLVIEKEGSFFIGGRDVYSDAVSSTSRRPPADVVTVDQMYVHYQIPVDAAHSPITLIHGGGLTGKAWETTPDGRMGWDEYFVRKGYPTYVVDQTARGRSAENASTINSVRLGRSPVSQLPTVLEVGRGGAWTNFRFGPEYPKVFPGMQFPLDAQVEFWKQIVPDWSESLPNPNPTVPALSHLAERLNGTVLISHSQSGIYGFQAAALSRKGIAGIVSIEPGSCPAANGDLQPYRNLPILVLFGDYVEESPNWSPRLKECKEFVAAANKSGGAAELVALPDVGFHGNSHMLMQDRNSLQVADWLLRWIDRHVTVEPPIRKGLAVKAGR